MKSNHIGIISIVIIGSLFGVVYGSSTIISDSGINTSNLTVTGTCTGCGGGGVEGNYTNYNTVDLNQTNGLGFPDTSFTNIHISNLGNVIYSGDTLNVGVKLNGIVNFANFSYSTTSAHQQDQSSTGKYQIIWDGTNTLVAVFKDGVFLQNLGINLTQFSTPGTNMHLAIAISPDGKYITVTGNDAVGGGTDDRTVIFRGT